MIILLGNIHLMVNIPKLERIHLILIPLQQRKSSILGRNQSQNGTHMFTEMLVLYNNVTATILYQVVA